ncbi:small GTP-binding protein [Pseudoxanthomonas suwonensis 11-1]|uniref:Elongation factor G n=1 Tax=Pseudoxanthomonas suwonensis (strain 11-1) TaxID=743721 RepID=E6WV42_PSEUU|nr:elongation factor G [Pseudoxanthomonas suwonensis]ADV28041.1 small GTP-binding protein [Pseudoxanthomonas suwonensis 11-1]
MPYTTRDIRNVALAGHPGAGKTTLFEALLHAGGVLATAGSVERGTTVSDSDPLEKARGHSLDIAIASVDHANGDGRAYHLNFIDTPGYPDFRGPALSALAAVETALVVVDADTGVEHGTMRLMERARERGLCRAIVVNKIDHEHADCSKVLQQLRDAFGPEVLPLNLPADWGRRVVDCFDANAGDSDLGPVTEWHQRILDQVVEMDEAVVDRYLEAGEAGVSAEELHDAFEKALREGHLVPVCFVSARSGVGVPDLLQLVSRLFPDPTEANPPLLLAGDGNGAQRPIPVSADADRHVIADVFKVVNDPFVGKLGVFRVYQGTVKRDTQLFVDDGRKPYRVGHLFALRGREHVEIEQAIPGDIAAVGKIEDVHFDAVLHDSHDEDGVHLAPVSFPKPMFGLAVEAASRGQEQKLSQALRKLAEEDPAFVAEHNVEVNETVIRGLSELHLRVMLERLKDRFGLEVTTRPPRIAYRETISVPAEGHCRHKKQTGGAGQFAEVFLRVEPLPRGAGFEFVDQVKGGVIPGQFIPAVEKGVRQALQGGAISGHPIQDVRVVVHDGRHHPVDSKEVAFVTAGRKAFLDAVAKARPLVLEPVVALEVWAPEAQLGDVTGALATRRARIVGTDSGDGLRAESIVRAQVPQAELEGFAAELKSLTAGKGRYALDFSHYEPVPPNVQQKLVEGWKPKPEED